MRRSPLSRHAVAFAALAAAVVLRSALDPLLDDALPFALIPGAVAAAVWIGGYRPAVLVAIVGYFACDYLFVQPRGRLHFADTGEITVFLAYVFTAALVIGFGEAMRAARARAHSQREVFRITLRSIGDAVITTDVAGRVTDLNEVR